MIDMILFVSMASLPHQFSHQCFIANKLPFKRFNGERDSVCLCFSLEVWWLLDSCGAKINQRRQNVYYEECYCKTIITEGIAVGDGFVDVIEE